MSSVCFKTQMEDVKRIKFACSEENILNPQLQTFSDF